MKTYWQAEICEHGDVENVDFPERATQAEAMADAADALDDELRQRRITAFATQWTRDADGFAENTGVYVEVDRHGNAKPFDDPRPVPPEPEPDFHPGPPRRKYQ